MATLWKLATSNAFNTSLNGNVGIADTSITLTSVTGLQAPGVLVLDRTTLAGTATPTAREYISYTGISTNTLTGVVRGLGGSTAQTHTSGNLVEEVFTISHWNDMVTAMLNLVTSAGILDVTKVTDLTSSQSLTNKTLAGAALSGTLSGSPTFSGKPVFTATVPTLVTDTDGSTVTFDLSAGNIHNVVLGGNRTLALSNASVGQPFVIRLTQDGTGSRTVTWFSTIKWAGGTAPTLTTTINKADAFGFICTSSGNYDGYIIGQNI
jgi:hypothetical protein